MGDHIWSTHEELNELADRPDGDGDLTVVGVVVAALLFRPVERLVEVVARLFQQTLPEQKRADVVQDVRRNFGANLEQQQMLVELTL